jgi:hypothetical protein
VDVSITLDGENIIWGMNVQCTMFSGDLRQKFEHACEITLNNHWHAYVMAGDWWRRCTSTNFFGDGQE